MNLYQKSKKMKTARNNGFKFNQIHKLKMKIYSNLSITNIYYYLKLQIPKMHWHFFNSIDNYYLEYIYKKFATI